jgi:hypothetical protein
MLRTSGVPIQAASAGFRNETERRTNVSQPKSVRGTVRKIGIEGGIYALITEAGAQIELIDPPDALKQNGVQAEIELDRKGSEVTVGMVGDAARVRSFKIL